jgi:hypothetical protein
MIVHFLYLLSNIAFSAPFLAIAAILAYYSIRRAIGNWKLRRGKNPGFYPSAAALGLVLLFVQVYYKPSESYVLEAQQEEQVEEDDQGDPDLAAKTLSRQLKRIRRGQPVEKLTVRL